MKRNGKRRTYGLLAALLAISLLLMGGCGRKQISFEEALQVVLDDAQVSESDITIVSREMDKGLFHAEYEFEFIYGDTKYKYEVNGYSGKITSFSHEPAEGVPQTNAAPSGDSSQAGSGASQPGADASAGAQDGTAASAGGQTDSSAGGQTGSQGTSQGGQDTQQSGAAGPALTEEQARQIALKDAGFAEADVSLLHTELDRDGGVLEYEVEFRKDGMEYQYSIDANTGEIRDYEKERD